VDREHVGSLRSPFHGCPFFTPNKSVAAKYGRVTAYTFDLRQTKILDPQTEEGERILNEFWGNDDSSYLPRTDEDYWGCVDDTLIDADSLLIDFLSARGYAGFSNPGYEEIAIFDPQKWLVA
jgi:hypothetical protein